MKDSLAETDSEKRFELAETRTDQANIRTQQADVRTNQANTRTDEANVRTKEANTRTERAEHSEQAVRASELSYRRLFEAARDGILILDVNTGRIDDVNPFLVELLGFSHAEMVGKTVGELSPFKDILSNQAMLERLQKDGYIRYENLPLETKDGRHIDVEFVSNVYQAGDVKVIQCNIRDITEHRRMEAELNRERDLWRALLDTSPDHIYFKDTQSRFIKSSKAQAGQFGLKSPDEMVGKTDFDFFTEAHARPAYEDEQEIIRTGRPMIAKEEKEVWHDGHVSWASSTKLPLRDGGGKIIGIIGISRDITGFKRLEDQLRQSQKMEAIGQLAGGVAHDFNNILAVVQLQVELLKIGSGLSAEQTKLADEISATVQRAAALTRQLLLFSRKETMQPHDLELNQSINSLAKMLQRILGEDIEMQFKFATQPLFIHADAGMIDQVLMNLAVNSRDAMPKGGRLVIETSAVDFDENVSAQSAQARPGAFVCLGVSDTGCGIAPENLSRIFEPFFTTKEVGKGTGLGLATLFGIVQQHRGWVNVYSEVGQGTTFRIYLPRLAGSSLQKTEPPVLPDQRGGHETILLVEDDNFLRPSISKTLARLGYRVREASNGVEALEIWKQHRDEIHLLLTDLVMPGGINGKELGERLLQENPKLKVIYASGYSAEIVSQDFPLEEGVNFLTKPFQAQKLAETIRQSLDAPA